MHRPNDFPRERRCESQWLVSVRDLSEARLAASYGVDILDWKEPLQGALAPVAEETWIAAANWAYQTGCPVPLSAALGEGEMACSRSRDLPSDFRWAKVGASRTNPDALQSLWSDVRQRLPQSVELVAVAYADAPIAECPDPEVVFELAAVNGFQRVLIDTYTKESGSSLEWMGGRMQMLSQIAKQHGLWWALAGSIQLAEAQSLPAQGLPNPDCFAVRGDVCRGDRTSTLDAARLGEWAGYFRAQSLQSGAQSSQPSRRRTPTDNRTAWPKEPSNPV